MASDVLTVADRLWRGELSTATFHPVDHVGGFVEITDGVGFCPSFANVSAFETEDGLRAGRHRQRTAGARSSTATSAPGARIASTPPSTRTATSTTSSACRSGRPRRREQGWAAPEVIAHHALPARFDRYIFTAGYNTIINRRQFGFADLKWPTEYRYPDRTYHDTLDLSRRRRRLRAAPREGRDRRPHGDLAGRQTKVLCCGDLFIWASPNAGNPQKVQRYPREWAARATPHADPGGRVPAPGPRVPRHRGRPGAQALTDTADLLDSLVDQTLAVMNAGGRLDDAIHSVAVPDGPGRRALPPARLRRARVHRPHRVAPVRRLVGRQPGHPQAGPRAGPGGRAGRAGRRGRRPGRPGARAPGPGRGSGHRTVRPRPTAPCAWPVTWPSTPGWPTRPTPGVQRARQQVFAARAARATSTMARASSTGPPTRRRRRHRTTRGHAH